ncbi:LysE family translocator [Agrococcus lahaulensis]|uniref:LysE family translocator n=1 Tax=Agrococcus lahaulensis TaxID=341722 RepID=UPI00047B08A4|nr:LysE family translocator [Agrococcus lahaulensis]
MIDLAPLWAFAAVALLVTLTPGVDTALTLRAAALAPRRGWGVAIGVQLGVLLWGTVSAAGVSALLAAAPAVMGAVRLAGAAYLIWVGGRLLWSALRSSARDAALPPTSGTSFLTGLRQGLVTNLLNPKIAAFYLAVLPQFVPATGSPLAWGAALAGMHALLGLVWLGALVLLVRTMRRWLARPRVQRSIDGVAGAAITGFGVAPAAQR